MALIVSAKNAVSATFFSFCNYAVVSEWASATFKENAILLAFAKTLLIRITANKTCSSQNLGNSQRDIQCKPQKVKKKLNLASNQRIQGLTQILQFCVYPIYFSSLVVDPEMRTLFVRLDQSIFSCSRKLILILRKSFFLHCSSSIQALNDSPSFKIEADSNVTKQGWTNTSAETEMQFANCKMHKNTELDIKKI